MDIVKKNLLSIIFGVIALAALVAWVWPLGSIKREAQSKLDERVSLYRSMQSMLSKERKLPDVSLTGASEAKPLGMFPTERIIEWGKSLQQKVKDESQGVKAVALRMNRRSLLVQDSLPVPLPTREFEFREKYSRFIQEFAKRVHAGTPPMPADITAAEQELWKAKFEPQLIIRDGRVDPASQMQVTEDFNKERVSVPDRVKTDKAKNVWFYMGDTITTLDVNGVVLPSGGTSAGAPTAIVIWDAQLKLWIQNDVVQAILDLNQRESKLGCVIDAPVKYLVKMQVSNPRGAKAVTAGASAMGPMGGMEGGGPPGMTMGPPPEAMAMMGGMGPGGAGGTSSAADSPTGRTSNSLYDVIPFKIVVHVEADKLPMFLEELGRGRFITPYQVSMQAIDSVIVGASQNVMYGPAPVVQATISCEAILLREWTVPLMPRDVQVAYGVEGAAAQPAQ